VEVVNTDELHRSVRDLQRQLDLAKDAEDATQRINAELKQTLKNRGNQLEVEVIVESTNVCGIKITCFLTYLLDLLLANVPRLLTNKE